MWNYLKSLESLWYFDVSHLGKCSQTALVQF